MIDTEKIELEDCPICGGNGLLEETDGYGYSVSCLDCGSRTVTCPTGKDEEIKAAQTAAFLWNTGKVIVESRGE